MFRSFLTAGLVLVCFSGLLFGQWVNVNASQDDWEEINFEFDSHILTDGFPSLLRLAELLGQNPDYRVRLVGHTDYIGSNRYNEGLAQRRASSVKSFLEKYGARPDQVTAEARGKTDPKLNEKTDEARFVNRRVEMTVTDGQGRTVRAGGVGDAIKALEDLAKKQEECCDAILKKLDKLDEILAALVDLKNENARLRSDVDTLKQGHSVVEKELAQVPKTPPVSEERISQLSEEAAKRAFGPRFDKFSLLGVNIGTDGEGKVAFTGKGRFFAPIGEHFAVQSEAEYMGWRTRKEGQFDFGFVSRYGAFQAGLFSSFKHVKLGEFERGGTLGQASIVGDYIFSRGRAGLFGSKGFMNSGIIGERGLGPNLVERSYLYTVDQLGLSATVGLAGRSYAEGNIGWLKGRQNPTRAGGRLRFILPVSEHWAFTAEGGINETLLERRNNGRWAVGVQWGNFLEPKRYAEVAHPVPADIPRVRYEVVTERIRTGNDAPVAIAGPNLIGIPAGQVTLDGSASYDPDGDPITFQWIQVAGPPVALSGANTAQATFTAEDGQVYGFRLEVSDNQGAKGIDRISISTRESPRVRIISFSATPPLVTAGQASTLIWNVENATEVSISPTVGSVNPQTGTVQVMPSQTTTYILTARNAVSEATASAIVVVDSPQPSFTRCQVTPANVVEGETATISWETRFATGVSISGIGNVAVNGNHMVNPTTSTTYTLTATNSVGAIDCSVTVQVARGSVPRILSFTANDMELLEGNSTTLQWQVEDAETVTIEGIGSVNPKAGVASVSPTQTTAYLLTATNRFGSIATTTTVRVYPQVQITSFTVNPTEVAPNGTFELCWATTGATEVEISNNIGTRSPSGCVPLQTPVTTTFTIVARNKLSSATATATISVTAPATSAGAILPASFASPERRDVADNRQPAGSSSEPTAAAAKRQAAAKRSGQKG
ncbi:MAG: OmpA family protein [Bryobacteraceae bacterium]|nr:OmpA family protein [Bryobacteraceae bacterium]